MINKLNTDKYKELESLLNIKLNFFVGIPIPNKNSGKAVPMLPIQH